MKILQVNKFLYPKGGDAIVTLETGKLLKSKGHEVSYWGMAHKDNPDFIDNEYLLPFVSYEGKSGAISYLNQAEDILYNSTAKVLLDKKIRKFAPDIIHLHNFAHQISPSILHVIKKHKIPTIMTMHDYKLVCASYKLFSKGKICGLCKGGRYYQCVVQKCVKNNHLKSCLNMIEMFLHHRILRIYDLIDLYVSPSQFLKDKIEEMGFRKNIIHIPNFVRIEEFIPSFGASENTILYVGRLSEEKGITTLIKAMEGITSVKLEIAGDGPMRKTLEELVKNLNLSNVKFLGFMNKNELMKKISNSVCVVLPSEWYENNPRSIIESFALGKPVIGARIGGIPELVKDEVTGVTFEAGNVNDLRSKINYILANRDKTIGMGKNARILVEKEFSADKYYESLMKAYESVINIKKERNV